MRYIFNKIEVNRLEQYKNIIYLLLNINPIDRLININYDFIYLNSL